MSGVGSSPGEPFAFLRRKTLAKMGVRVGFAERFLQDFYLIPRRTRRK
jgi:hypothetical protein